VCHHLGAAREVHAEDCGQKLWAEPYGEGDREHQCLDRRPAANHVGDEDEEHHSQHRAGQQVPEPANAAVELVLRRPEREAVGDRAELRGGTGGDDEGSCGAATDVGAEEETVGAPRERGGQREHTGLLLDRIAFASQHRLAREAVGGFEHDDVCRDQAAGRQQHDVARNDVFERKRHALSVANDARTRPDPGA
jgi:hypothetical protein